MARAIPHLNRILCGPIITTSARASGSLSGGSPAGAWSLKQRTSSSAGRLSLGTHALVRARTRARSRRFRTSAWHRVRSHGGAHEPVLLRPRQPRGTRVRALSLTLRVTHVTRIMHGAHTGTHTHNRDYCRNGHITGKRDTESGGPLCQWLGRPGRKSESRAHDEPGSD